MKISFNSFRPFFFTRLTLSSLAFFLLLLTSHGSRQYSLEETLEAAEQIDLYVAEQLEVQGLARNEAVDDFLFSRRVHLDISGRIPTYQEQKRFLDSIEDSKRSLLIDQLLDSEGYVSHFYNYWADILRVKSRGRRTPMVSYQDWIKDSLRGNKPYDQFVTEMVTSEGYIWEDPAVGYYVRDAGMPLDNMSNTAQVFLGTRMQCAQCHDHPFDQWTQKEYYHMAAYTYGLRTQTRYRDMEGYQEFQRAARQAMRSEIVEEGGDPRDRRNYRNRFTGGQRRAMRDLFQPLQVEVKPTDRKLQLPDDYQYDDARPKQLVSPETPFGDELKVSRNQDPREAYADWMTSPQNPRFTIVIANRLWKKAMGIGIIEPVDDIKEDTVASHPELMEFLSDLMVSYDYDMKQFMRTILNTRIYQSIASLEDPVPGEPYYFQGPLLRRMTAEQLWDSVLALGVPGVDMRLGGDAQVRRLREGERRLQEQVENVNSLSGYEVYALVKSFGKTEEKYLEAEKEYQAQLANASTEAERRQLRRDFQRIRREKNAMLERMVQDVSGNRGAMMASMSDQGMMASDSNDYASMKKNGRPRYNPSMVRASEIVSPAPPGHFLRQFGQSDREIIENSNTEASIPQALALLNGAAPEMLTKRFSPLSVSVEKANSPKEREDVVFLSFLGRLPSDHERQLARKQMETHGSKKGYEMLISALLNTQEFRFIQ